jgi:hypothetical protein
MESWTYSSGTSDEGNGAGAVSRSSVSRLVALGGRET